MASEDPQWLAYAAAAVVLVSVATVAWRRRATNPRMAVGLALVGIGAGWWSAAAAFSVLGADGPLGGLGRVGVYPGVGTAVAGFVAIGLAVAAPDVLDRRRVRVALGVHPVLVTVVAATNPVHLLLFQGARADALLGSTRWTFGPAFWVHTAYSYSMLVLAMGLIVRGWWTSPPVFRAQRASLLVAAFLPLASNVVKVVGGLGGIQDPTPIGFAAGGLLMAHAIFRQDVLTFSPVARALIIEQISDAVVAVGPTGRVLDLNPAAVALIRRTTPTAGPTLVGEPVRALLGRELGGELDAVGDELREVSIAVGRGQVELHVRGSRLVDRQGRFLGSVLVARDVTEVNAQSRDLAQANARLVQQLETIERLRADLAEAAHRDALTGLHNRRHMVDRFASMVGTAARTGTSLAVVMIDVDRFKTVNDTYGHLTGDAVLVAIAARLAAHAPAGALVARWGGEEFFVAIPGADVDAAARFADEVRDRCVREPVEVAGGPVPCTLSGGVAAFPGSGTSADALVQVADAALYAAKAGGRNRICTHAEPVPSTGRTSVRAEERSRGARSGGRS
ncbi:diguanylate cyclase [Cellulomonas fimi]|uniref:Diguanylate cyclase n=1 Tax=Cellulomonas fimi TaxID=1708 RepID=A0A7Y0M0T6_CELFI|nr:diguanylate cyclase [Cellulomonas fimi]NMR21334.1 diguanylate cyclase [Cellulomonas fimi]